jgi:Na+-translocating ferredoxin:NAD+ oxidoreductase subunit G
MSEQGAVTAAPAMPKSSTLILTLGMIAMMSGLLVVLTFQLTRERIAHNRQQALEKAVFAVLPEASVRRNFLLDESGLTPLTDADLARANLFAGYAADGRLTGIAMEASARGYQDVVTILYGYSPATECVIGFIVLQSTETPGLGDKVETDPDFLANFDCLDARLNEAANAVANEIVTVKNGNKEHPWQIDGISGATVTSVAIGNALRDSTTRMLPLFARHRGSLPDQLPE